MGEYVGKVKEIRGGSFNVAGTASFANGDGLCFVNDEHELEGFRVNRAEGNRLFPLRMPQRLRPGMALYRNNDVAFEKVLAGKTAERRTPVQMVFRPVDGGFEVRSGEARAFVAFGHQEAKKPQQENIVRQLGKLGNTPFLCSHVAVEGGNFFVPSSLLAELRRQLVEELLKGDVPPAGGAVPRDEAPALAVKAWQPAYARFPYLYNISNRRSFGFYERRGLAHPGGAFELEGFPQGSALLMQCRHCIRYSLGYCVKRGGRSPYWKEPLHLVLPDGRRFRLEFACKECQMNVYAE